MSEESIGPRRPSTLTTMADQSIGPRRPGIVKAFTTLWLSIFKKKDATKK
jgi:hypothetical protein